MPIGVGAAMLIGSAAAGGSAIASAKLQSNAAKNAAKQQQDATNRALAVQQQQNAPYLQLGQQAAQRIGQQAANFQPYTQVFGNGAGAQMPQGPPPGSLAGLGQMGMGQPQAASPRFPGVPQAPQMVAPGRLVR